MKTNYLLPHSFKKIGYCLVIPFLIMGIYCLIDPDILPLSVSSSVFGFIYNDNLIGPTKFLGITKTDSILDEIAIIGLTISLIFIAFSKEKDEDEYIMQIRLRTLIWAIIFTYFVLILATIFIYGISFLSFSFINYFTVLILFIIKFQWEIYKLRRTPND